MVEIILQSGSKLKIKSLTFKGSIVDSNGLETGGNADFVFIESEVNSLEAQLNAMGMSIQNLYNAVFPPLEAEQEQEQVEEQ